MHTHTHTCDGKQNRTKMTILYSLNVNVEMSLWTARMFKAVDSPSESFRLTLDVVNDGGPLREAPFYSMGEVLSAFDKKAFLHMRNELRAQIADSKM